MKQLLSGLGAGIIVASFAVIIFRFIIQKPSQSTAPPLSYSDAAAPSYIEEQARRFNIARMPYPITEAGAALGRALFYDTKLSKDNTIACGSCHSQELAFSGERPQKEGVRRRDVMGLSMMAYYPRNRFLSDEKAASVEEQIFIALQHTDEMQVDLVELEHKLAAIDYYPPMFEKAFGDSSVTRDKIANAIAQFVFSMESYHSKYDTGRLATHTPGDEAPWLKPFPNFTEQENEGKKIFFDEKLGNCAACHVPDLFTLMEPADNGIGLKNDGGVGEANKKQSDYGKFKAPSLRNIAFTPPYMHDGRFENLRQVVEHYNNGVQMTPNLDPKLRSPDGKHPRKLGLNEAQVRALVAFLETLTDYDFMQDPRWASPLHFDGKEKGRRLHGGLAEADVQDTGVFFPAEKLKELLAHPGCVGIRFYPGKSGLDNKKPAIIAVGLTAMGVEIFKKEGGGYMKSDGSGGVVEISRREAEQNANLPPLQMFATYFSREDMQILLSDPACIGVRIFTGFIPMLNTRQHTHVAASVQSGAIISGVPIMSNRPCPPDCHPGIHTL